MAIALPADAADPAAPVKATLYGWAVFAISFGLLISDYMARQVLGAVFPLLKAEWALSDGQLGLLSGVVPAMVGLLTFPLSLAADRFGRVRSLTAMATLWSLATLLCARAGGFDEMLIGRALVGLGEAAYGSVGIAVVIAVFPRTLRGTLTAAFMAGSLVGQVLGVAFGAQVAATHGWRSAFLAIGVAGLGMAVLYPLIVRERRIGAMSVKTASAAPPLRALVASRSIRLAYLGSGLHLFAAGALPAWLPTYLTRYYAMPLASAGRLAALLLLVCGAGMTLCGMISDRFGQDRPERKITLAIAYCLCTAASLSLALALPPGLPQLVLLGLAMATIAGASGPAGAMVANLSPLALHGSAFAALTLANNLVGLAPGSIVTGRLADAFGLLGALRLLPLSSLAAAAVFALMHRSYRADLGALRAAPAPSPT